MPVFIQANLIDGSSSGNAFPGVVSSEYPCRNFSERTAGPDRIHTPRSTANTPHPGQIEDVPSCHTNSLMLTGEHGSPKASSAGPSRLKELRHDVPLPPRGEGYPSGGDDTSKGQNVGQHVGQHVSSLRVMPSYDGQSEVSQSRQYPKTGSDVRRVANHTQSASVSPFTTGIESPSSQPLAWPPTPAPVEDLSTAPRTPNVVEKSSKEGNNKSSLRTKDLSDSPLSYKRHRRNQAALHLSSVNISPSTTNSRADPDREIPILSPEPISPARELKVRRSIPQLLKDLPAPPDDEDEGNNVARDLVSGPLAARQSEKQSLGRSDGKRQKERTAQAPHDPAQQGRRGFPRLRLKIKKSESQESHAGLVTTNGVDLDSQATSLGISTGPDRKKLRVKMSRNQKDSQIGTGPGGSTLNLSSSLSSHGQSHPQTSVLANNAGLQTAVGADMSEFLTNIDRTFSASRSGLQHLGREHSPKSPAQGSPSERSAKRRASISIAGEAHVDAEVRTADENVPAPRRGMHQKISTGRLSSDNKRRGKLAKQRESPAPAVSVESVREYSSQGSMTHIPSRTTMGSAGRERRKGRFKKFTKKAKRFFRRLVRRKADE